MKKVVFIHKGKVHCVQDVADNADFSPQCECLDVSNEAIIPEQGWSYDSVTGTFTPPETEPEV